MAPTRHIEDAHLRALAKHLHLLGERPLYEFLREVLSGADIGLHLERYARLPSEFIAALGGNSMLPTARLVSGSHQ